MSLGRTACAALAGGLAICANPPAEADLAESIRREPLRYLENDRLKLGVDLRIGGAVTVLTDKTQQTGNMINSHDWGRQIQLSYYSGPIPFIGPEGQQPRPEWRKLGWNPIQAGSSGGVRSQVTAFERGEDFLRVRCVPMQWPLANVPGDCEFETTWRIKAPNALLLEARLTNRRADKTQYLDGREQEMPAIYTNGRWYRLVTYLGDRPFTGGDLSTIVGKGDGKGWPWSRFLATENWAALVDETGHGVGVHHPGTIWMAGGFHGGDALKGAGGPKDNQTGYLAPLARVILDHNIDHRYQSHIMVGSLEEIRAFAVAQERRTLEWSFANERCGWRYVNASDTGWPINDGLRLRYEADPRGEMLIDSVFWRAEDAGALELEASFGGQGVSGPLAAELVILPFGPGDMRDEPMWPHKGAIARQPEAVKPILIPFPVRADGNMHLYRVALSGVDGYRGGMRRLGIRFPAAGGDAHVRRVALTR